MSQTTAQPRPATVIAGLVAGLARFTNQTMIHPHEQWQGRGLSKQQTPPICVLACADSRVPPEIIFDQGLGDMFVVRVAGNLADEDDQASIEYAVQQFDPPPAIILVMGHEKCGAVTAATIVYDVRSVPEEIVGRFRERGTPSRNLLALASRLQSAIEHTKWAVPDPELWDQRLHQAVIHNIRDNVAILRANAVIAQSIERQKTFVVGARYDLDKASIEWMVPLPGWPGIFGLMANNYCLSINASMDGTGAWVNIGTLILDERGAARYVSATDEDHAAPGIAVGAGFIDPQSGRLVADRIPNFSSSASGSIDVKIGNGDANPVYGEPGRKCDGWCLSGTGELRMEGPAATATQVLVRGCAPGLRR